MKLEKLDPKTDERGTLVEAFKFPHDGQVYYIHCQPGFARGNHYHTRKSEQFVVLYGTAEITVKDRETCDVMTAELTGEKPMVVSVAPNNTHRVVATDGGCILLSWIDEVYNPEDTDTIMEEI